MKYGQPEKPHLLEKPKEKVKQQEKEREKNKLFEKIGENNIGNKMLQQMGWREGEGLGRHNTGITNPIGVLFFFNFHNFLIFIYFIYLIIYFFRWK